MSKNFDVSFDFKKINVFLDKLKKDYKEENIKGVKAGYFQDKKYANGFDLAKNALVQNYGNERIPARPFLTLSLRHKEEWLILFKKNMQKDLDAKKNLLMVGEMMKNTIKYEINKLLKPANALSTIRRKRGSKKPLVDTGMLKNNVMSELIQG